MKSIFSLRLIAFVAVLYIQQQSILAQTVNHIDYNVPESPALTVLDADPSKALKGDAAKPLAVSILNQILTGGTLHAGIALDFIPYLAFGGPIESPEKARTDVIERIGSNLQFSAATVQDQSDTSSIVAAAGLRYTFFDNLSPLLDADLQKSIIDEVSNFNLAKARHRLHHDMDSLLADTSDRALIYKRFIDTYANTPGKASLSGGVGLSSRLRNAIINSDSIDRSGGKFWVAFSLTLGKGYDLQSSVIGTFSDSLTPTQTIGVGIRKHIGTSETHADAAYDFQSNHLDFSGNIVFRLIDHANMIASVKTDKIEDPQQQGHFLTKLKFQASLQWSLNDL